MFFVESLLPIQAQTPHPSTADRLLNDSLLTALNDYNYDRALYFIGRLPATATTLFQKGKALQALGRTTDALQSYEEAAALDSLNPRIQIAWAECCREMGKWSQARTLYEKAIQLNPTNTFVRMRHITMLLATNQYQQALQERYAPRRHSLLYTAAFSACYHLKDSDHTIQLLEAYLRTRPKESQQPVTMTKDEDYVITGDRYNAAENWLNDLRKSKKIEDFFEGHVTP